MKNPLLIKINKLIKAKKTKEEIITMVKTWLPNWDNEHVNLLVTLQISRITNVWKL